MNAQPLSISVFFPCYNDARSIEKLVGDARRALRAVAEDWEIIIVNDGSTDESTAVLKRMARRILGVRVITHTKNMGYGVALRTGFTAAKKNLVFYTDGDGQYDPKELAHLLLLMSPEVDFVNGIKIARKDPTYRIVLGNWYSIIARWMFWLPVTDVDCDFRLIRKSVLNNITLTSTSGAVCVELVKKAQRAGATFRQVSVHHYERRFGRSQFFRMDRLLVTLWELIQLWWWLIVKYRFYRLLGA